MTSEERPLVTLALLTFNQAGYIEDAVAGALAQDYSPLEIILSDDCSRDETYALMERAVSKYAGPHRITLNRNPVNLGVGAHVAKIGALAQGELVVAAAGDDISAPHRVRALVRAWQDAGMGTACLYSDFTPIDASSAPVDLGDEAVFVGPHSLEAMARGQVRILGATSAVTRDVFAAFPPLASNVIHEDRVLPFRALLRGGRALYVDEALVRYRAEGGVSRNRVPSMRAYVRDVAPALARRTLPDAIQRLADALYARPDDLALRHACEATIADLEARIEFARTPGSRYEAALVKWLFKGARPMDLAKHYLKHRLVAAFG